MEGGFIGEPNGEVLGFEKDLELQLRPQILVLINMLSSHQSSSRFNDLIFNTHHFVQSEASRVPRWKVMTPSDNVSDGSRIIPSTRFGIG